MTQQIQNDLGLGPMAFDASQVTKNLRAPECDHRFRPKFIKLFERASNEAALACAINLADQTIELSSNKGTICGLTRRNRVGDSTNLQPLTLHEMTKIVEVI